PGAALAEAAKDVLDADHRIVDDFADRDRESAQGHRVQRVSELLQHRHGHEQRERNGAAGNDGGAEMAEKKKQHDDDEDAAEDQGDPDVLRGGLDENRYAGWRVVGGGTG